MNKKGFTLIELLVTIAIIIVLASLVIVSVSTARSKGRDGKRTADLANIQLALEMYKDSKGYYPDISGTWQTWFPVSTNTDFATAIGSYLSPIPKDPLNKEKYYYQAQMTAIPTTSTTKNGYRLRVRMENIENSNNTSDTTNKCYYLYGGTETTINTGVYGEDVCH